MKNKKIICFDLRPLQIGHESRGIGMVVKSILENLQDDGNQYIFYNFDRSNPIEQQNIKIQLSKYKIVSTPTLKHAVKERYDVIDAIKIMSHRFKPLKKYHPDVFVQFDSALGVPKWRHTKTYVVGYDLIPLIMQNKYLPSPMASLRHDRFINPLYIILGVFALPFHLKKASSIFWRAVKRLKQYLRNSYHLMRYKRSLRLYKKVTGILCISRATKQSFRELLDIPSDRLHDLPLAPVMSKTNPTDTVAKTIKKPYLFYIGGTDDRKRVQDIIYAFNVARGRGEDIALVLAGNEFNNEIDKIPNLTIQQAIQSSPYKNDIHLVGFINDEEKLGLYQSALAFVFASSYEGFGLPILEAAEMHCPVIAYKNSSIAELSNAKSAMLVETGDFVGLARAVKELSSKTLRVSITNEAKKKSTHYNWHKTTDLLLSVLDR